MKCIQAIKDTKHSKAGDIKRLSDSEARSKVDMGNWKFVPKSEWKSATRKISTDQILKEHQQSETAKSK